MIIIRTLVRGLDLLSYWSGRVFCWLVVAIIVSISYEVVARYFFNAPTFWSYDMAYYLGGSFLLLGACYVTLVKGHVRIDVFSMRFPPKLRLWIEIIFTLIFFMPLWGFLIKFSWSKFALAWKIGELSDVGFWMPIIWPIRLTVALGITLLFLANISWLIKCIYELKTGNELHVGLEGE